MYQQRFSFLAWVALVGIPSMLLDNLEKYIIQFGEINFVLWINVSNKWKDVMGEGYQTDRQTDRQTDMTMDWGEWLGGIYWGI